MKREAICSTKLTRLCRRLGVRKCEAVGILECLWHLTAREAPRGDIGRLSDEDIAIWVDYPKEAELIEALVDSHWLDRSAEYRLITHDWSEHADDTTDVKLARHGQTYADGKLPRMTKLAAKERNLLISRYYSISANLCAQKATISRKKALPEPEPEPEPEVNTKIEASSSVSGKPEAPIDDDAGDLTELVNNLAEYGITESGANTISQVSQQIVPDRTTDEVLALFAREWPAVCRRPNVHNKPGLMISTVKMWFSPPRVQEHRDREKLKELATDEYTGWSENEKHLWLAGQDESPGSPPRKSPGHANPPISHDLILEVCQ